MPVAIYHSVICSSMIFIAHDGDMDAGELIGYSSLTLPTSRREQEAERSWDPLSNEPYIPG